MIFMTQTGNNIMCDLLPSGINWMTSQYSNRSDETLHFDMVSDELTCKIIYFKIYKLKHILKRRLNEGEGNLRFVEHESK